MAARHGVKRGAWRQGVIRAKPKYIDGIWFPSTGEADTYAVLATWQNGGVIRELERQPKVTLLPEIPEHSIQAFIWRPDFTFIDDRDVRVWLDAKDRPTSKREDVIIDLWRRFGPGPLRLTRIRNGRLSTIREIMGLGMAST